MTLTPLEYLVPSKNRRDLLRLLLRKGEGLSLRQLAHQGGVPYSGAHREVELLLQSGLLETERVGNALVCRWNKGHPQAEAIEHLFAATPEGADDETVFTNLKRWHAPLLRESRSLKELPLEETLAHALLLARHHPEVALAWPVTLARNMDKVDFERLGQVARRLGEKRTLGFFLAVAARLLGLVTLQRQANRFRDARTRKTEEFFLLPRGDRARRLAEENTSELARKWLFRMNLPMDSFESFFRKHGRVRQTVSPRGT